MPYLFLAVLCAGLVNPGVVDAQSRSNRVDFSVTVPSSENADDAEQEEEDRDMRVRRHREVSEEVVRRLERRLEIINVKNSRIDIDDQHNIHVTVYGDYSSAAVRGALIPTGELELRPVNDDAVNWVELVDELPDEVHLRSEPGTFQTDRMFLYASSASTLRSVIDRVAPGSAQLEIYPFEDGWRSIALGDSTATESDVASVSIDTTPAGIPYVTVQLNADAAQRLRSAASDQQARHVAIVLDGEVVGLYRFVDRTFSEELILDPPDHLRSRDGRARWAIQVAGRLATPIPVRLVELQE